MVLNSYFLPPGTVAKGDDPASVWPILKGQLAVFSFREGINSSNPQSDPCMIYLPTFGCKISAMQISPSGS